MAISLKGRRRDGRSRGGGRAFHLLDVENLAGAARPSDVEVAAVLDLYRRAVSVGSTDLVVVAANRYTALAAGWAWPGVLVRAASGPDGADHALLGEADVSDVTRRFDRVIIGSGDHVFASLASDLQAAGVKVEVVSRPGSLSRQLREAAGMVRHLPVPSVATIEAA